MSRSWAAVWLLLAASAGASAYAEGLDLQATVDIALAQNPGYLAVVQRRTEVAGGIEEARAEALPQFSLLSSWNRSRSPSLLNSADFEDFLPGDFLFKPREQQLWDLGVEVAQPIFTWGKIGTALKLAKTVGDVTESQIATARLDTALAAAEAYFGVLAAQEALRTIEIQRQVRDESLANVEARYELGDATRLELLQSKSALAQIIPLIRQAEGLVVVAGSQLRSVLGIIDPTPLEVAPMESPLPDVPPLEEVLALAREWRPEFLDLNYQRQALGQQAKVIQADGKPQIDFRGAYGRNVREVENVGNPLYDDWRLTVALRWNFFDGYRRKGQVAQIESQREQLAWGLVDLETRVILEVERSLAEYVTAYASWEASRAAAEAAREASRVAQENYNEGVALQTDLLTAQEREVQAEVLRVQSIFEAWTSAARVARAMGFLPIDGWRRLEAAGRQAEEE